MSKLIKITEDNFEKFNKDIADSIRNKGISDSGEAINSLRISTTKNSVASFGIDYIYYLDKGRRPGKFPPPQNIVDWINSKLGISDEKETNSLAYLVGRKISLEGTEIFKDRSKGIQLDEKTEKLQKQLKDDAPKATKEDLLIELKDINKTISVNL